MTLRGVAAGGDGCPPAARVRVVGRSVALPMAVMIGIGK